MTKRIALFLSLAMILPSVAGSQEAAFSQLKAAAGGAVLAAPPAPRLGTFPPAVNIGRSPFPGIYTGVDQDGDGLEDGAESALAEEFRPWLAFDTHENANRPGEPLTLFQVRPDGCVGGVEKCPAPLRIRIVYANLWARDGGYGPASFFCGGRDTHIGDDQSVEVLLRSDDQGTTYRPESVHIGAFTWPTNSGEVQWYGSHFRLVLSSGKHHHFFDTMLHGRESPYSNWGCADTMDAKGASFLSVLGGNVGEPESHGSPFVGDLSHLGFPGEHAWDTRPFCGALKCDRTKNPTSPTSRMWSRAPYRKP